VLDHRGGEAVDRDQRFGQQVRHVAANAPEDHAAGDHALVRHELEQCLVGVPPPTHGGEKAVADDRPSRARGSRRDRLAGARLEESGHGPVGAEEHPIEWIEVE
jgi:hypothetical protein